MKFVITDNLSFTDLPWQQSVIFSASKSMKIKNVTVLVSELQIVSDDKFHETPPPPPPRSKLIQNKHYDE